MPYIKKEVREGLDSKLSPVIILLNKTTRNAGVLNYMITKILLATNPKYYEDYNALVGVLECIKLELYRRVIVPYEDKKREEHGDVY